MYFLNYEIVWVHKNTSNKVEMFYMGQEVYSYVLVRLGQWSYLSTF